MEVVFFVGIRSNEKVHLFLVTARHVAAQLTDRVAFRTNTQAGSTHISSNKDPRWHHHPSDPTADVAITLAKCPWEDADASFVDLSAFISDQDIAEHRVDVGDVVSIIGTFAFHAGRNQNSPILRTANVAMIPSERVATHKGHVEAYLIEARSIGGLSGSPAFVHIATESDEVKPRLLGLVQGHWELAPEDKNSPYISDALGKVNMGIAIVVPAKKILATLNHLIATDPEYIRAKQAPNVGIGDRRI